MLCMYFEYIFERLVFDMQFTTVQMTFLKSQSWQQFVASVEKNWIVTVDAQLESATRVIRLVGVASQLSEVESMVRSQLEEKSVTSVELEMSAGKLRYLDAYRRDFR